MNNPAYEQFRPLALYETLYGSGQRTFAIPATVDPDEWAAWQDAFRARLWERLGGLQHERAPVTVTVAPPVVYPDYQRAYVEFESSPGVTVPAWLLVPTGLSDPAPAVVAAHGHGYGMDDTVGINPDGSVRSEPQGYHQDFAIQLCRRGMVVLVPELRAFGRRRELSAQADSPATSSCREAAWWGIMLGKPLLGSRVWDVLRALDVLESLPQVDAQRMGIMGGSGGGAVALFAAALEQRLKAVVLSNYFCTFRDSILAIEHCYCNYVPGLLQDAEMYDIAALIAPRPLLIATGSDDPIFPLPGVLEAFERVHASYTSLGIADRIAKDVFKGGHQMASEQAYDFLWNWLSQPEIVVER